jgi:hypothetical protein
VAIGADPAWQVVYRSHGIEVLRRQSAGGPTIRRRSPNVLPRD